jgi:hypothetical protein
MSATPLALPPRGIGKITREHHMYKLKATLGSTERYTYLVADDDSQAMLDAIGYILDEATTKEVWAKGRIELLSETGEVINVMEAK